MTSRSGRAWWIVSRVATTEQNQPYFSKTTPDEETLAAYFHPPQAELFDDPVVGPTLRRLAAEDPDVLAAVADVDRSQIRDCMKRSPGERLRFAMANWNGIARCRRGS